MFKASSVFKLTAASIILLFANSVVALDLVAADVRDPTRPLFYSAINTGVSSEQLILNSILMGSKRKLATINGVSLREGDLIPNAGGAKVHRILAQRVELIKDGKIWALELSPSVVRKY